jgi:hypothetical protein
MNCCVWQAPTASCGTGHSSNREGFRGRAQKGANFWYRFCGFLWLYREPRWLAHGYTLRKARIGTRNNKVWASIIASFAYWALACFPYVYRESPSLKVTPRRS